MLSLLPRCCGALKALFFEGARGKKRRVTGKWSETCSLLKVAFRPGFWMSCKTSTILSAVFSLEAPAKLISAEAAITESSASVREV